MKRPINHYHVPIILAHIKQTANTGSLLFLSLKSDKKAILMQFLSTDPSDLPGTAEYSVHPHPALNYPKKNAHGV